MSSNCPSILTLPHNWLVQTASKIGPETSTTRMVSRDITSTSVTLIKWNATTAIRRTFPNQRANAGLKRARAPLVARMDSDDLSAPTRLERQAAFLAAHPQVGVLGTARTDIDERGMPLRTHRLPSGNAALQRLLYFRTPFFHPAVMARKAVLLKAGGYDEKLEVAEDYDLWARVASQTQFANLAQPLLFYRGQYRALQP